MVNDYLREVMGGNGEGFTAKDFHLGRDSRALAFSPVSRPAST